MSQLLQEPKQPEFKNVHQGDLLTKFSFCVLICDFNDIQAHAKQLNIKLSSEQAIKVFEKLQQMNKMFPHNGKWHSIIEHDGQVHVDNKTIRRRTAESMT
ncbi:MAG: hypothetical protein ACE5HI_01950 [bacterium]